MRDYFFSPVWRWEDGTRAELMMLRAYVSNVEAMLEQGMMGLAQKEIVVFERGTPDEHSRVFIDGIDEDNWDVEGIYNEELPRFQRSAALLTLCAWFEDRLQDLCRTYQEVTGCSLSLKDLKGSGVTRARTYLKKVIGLDLSDPNHESAWQEVQDVYTVRNAIAHVGGELTSLTEQQRQAVQRTLALDPQTLELTDRSLSLALHALHRLASTIFRATKDRHHALRSQSRETL